MFFLWGGGGLKTVLSHAAKKQKYIPASYGKFLTPSCKLFHPVRAPIGLSTLTLYLLGDLGMMPENDNIWAGYGALQGCDDIETVFQILHFLQGERSL